MVTRGGPLCAGSGARWVMDLLTPEEQGALVAEVEATMATDFPPYQPTVRITLTDAAAAAAPAPPPLLAAPIPAGLQWPPSGQRGSRCLTASR